MTRMAQSAAGVALPRGADFSRVADDATRPVDEYGLPIRNQYAGLPVLTDSLDVHEKALALVKKHVPASARVLDVGAGAGAFSKRLLDHGYGRVEAVEVNAAAFRVPGVPVHALNLEEPWAARLNAPADALVSLEVIEHLENPWHFARQCAAAIRPGGTVVLSTPNVESSRSRIEFLLNAEFRFFREKDFRLVGHVTSLPKTQLERVFAAAGFELLEHDHSRHKGVRWPTSARKLLRACLYVTSYPFMRGARRGETGLFAFRRNA